MSEPLTDAELQEILDRWVGTTPPPWRTVGGSYVIPSHGEPYKIAQLGGTVESPGAIARTDDCLPRDAEAIAHAPEDVRRLAAEVQRLKTELATAKGDGAIACLEALHETIHQMNAGTGLFASAYEEHRAKITAHIQEHGPTHASDLWHKLGIPRGSLYPSLTGGPFRQLPDSRWEVKTPAPAQPWHDDMDGGSYHGEPVLMEPADSLPCPECGGRGKVTFLKLPEDPRPRGTEMTCLVCGGLGLVEHSEEQP